MKQSDEPSRISRRRALALLGKGASAAALGGTAILTLARDGSAAGPQAGIIRTLLGDLTPSALPDGAILFHEHLSMRFPIGSDSSFSDDVDLMIREVRIAQDEGVGVIVDGGHPDMARNLDNLRRIARETGMPVVASGGYYMQNTYPPELATKSAEQIGEELAAEATRDGLGALGEIGQEEGVLTADERKVFRAVGLAHVRTGLPIFTHNAYSRRDPDVPRDAALTQLDILEGAGASPSSICIGHVCCLDDPSAEIATRIAERGAYVGFDRVNLNFTMPDENRVRMAVALIEAGHADKLLLSSDFYSGRTLKENDGPGIAQTVTVFVPMLLEAGVPRETVRMILEDNPRRFLTFEPRA